MRLFYGQVVDGIPEFDRPIDLKRYLRETLEGERFEVEFRRRRTKRSLEQNAWLWGPAYTTILYEYHGYDMDEQTEELKQQLHEELLRAYFGVVKVPSLTGGPAIERPARRSSKLTTKEFSEFMEWVVRYAARVWGVVLALPDEDIPVVDIRRPETPLDDPFDVTVESE